MNLHLIKNICIQKDLTTYDPYDIWKSHLGLEVKALFNRSRMIGILPAAFLMMFDHFINNSLRIGYRKQEYPMVRALAALALLASYKKENNRILLDAAKYHIDSLVSISSHGYSGFCCGMNAPWSSKNGRYPEAMPYSTNTPYALEALIRYSELAKSNEYDTLISSVFCFLEKDLLVMHEDAISLALSYAPVYEPRIVINANSYSMFMYALLLVYLPQHRDYIVDKIKKLYCYIIDRQADDGSWEYYADSLPGNFTDCFHSCFILKNIIKTSRIVPLNAANDIVKRGYTFLTNKLYDPATRLYKRFAKTDKLGLVKYDLYDNAEMLALAVMLGDMKTAADLIDQIERNFIKDNKIYSVIDRFGFRRNSNMLRWAVMPYVNALSEYCAHE
ncbi:hypothetical protein FY034_06255 [Trichlorobacter lovleyi]|uniref:hypothetical protein n=1 Tax=Trichlorobacter lovleyi TaxID=313985 RepID=UPI00223F6124|nr:hypothetical protein [Trichlorobacter lovleyi]QOX78546.1 hypothetical protein FY034_06255 [Trichlorobacter lovleyi]